MAKSKARDKDSIDTDKPHLLLCEGADAYYFLCHLLDSFEKSEPKFQQFKIYDFGGNEELRKYLRNKAETDGFKNLVRSLSIIRDAETDTDASCQSVKGALLDTGLAVPDAPCSWTAAGTGKYPDIRTGFVLFPACDANPESGTLEDLCLRMLAAENAERILSDADAALEPYKPQLPRMHKNRLHTYFSLTEDLVSLKVGEAARARAFRYDVPQIESLKSFLSEAACGNP